MQNPLKLYENLVYGSISFHPFIEAIGIIDSLYKPISFAF
ncbi:hypothetical protein STZ1_11050 [Bacillus subtilis]